MTIGISTYPASDFRHQTLESRLKIVTEEIARQLDMQHDVIVAQPYHHFVEDYGFTAPLMQDFCRLIAERFPFVRPVDLLKANTVGQMIDVIVMAMPPME